MQENKQALGGAYTCRRKQYEMVPRTPVAPARIASRRIHFVAGCCKVFVTAMPNLLPMEKSKTDFARDTKRKGFASAGKSGSSDFMQASPCRVPMSATISGRRSMKCVSQDLLRLQMGCLHPLNSR